MITRFFSASLKLLFPVLYISLLLSSLSLVLAQTQSSGLGAAAQKIATRVQEAERTVEKVKKKWEQLQKERDEYAAQAQDVGGRWASTTLQMYWVTRSKEMREKQLKAEENNAYFEWWTNQKGQPASKLTKEVWRETSEAKKLIKKNDKIRSELNSVYIRAINDLDRIGFKGDDGTIQALDKRQKNILAEYQRALENLESLRKQYADALQHKAAAMIFQTTKEDFHININETAKICYYIIDGTAPFQLRISTTDGEITQNKTLTAAPTGLSCAPVKFSKPGTRTVYLDLTDSSMPRQTKLIPVVFYVGESEKEALKQEEKKNEPAKQNRNISLASAQTDPQSLKPGQKTTLHVRYRVNGITPDEKLTATTNVTVTGTQKLPFSDKTEVFSGANAKDGTAEAVMTASAAFAKSGDYAWNYKIDIPGFESLSNSVPFQVQQAESTPVPVTQNTTDKIIAKGDCKGLQGFINSPRGKIELNINLGNSVLKGTASFEKTVDEFKNQYWSTIDISGRFSGTRSTGEIKGTADITHNVINPTVPAASGAWPTNGRIEGHLKDGIFTGTITVTKQNGYISEHIEFSASVIP